MIPRRWRVIDRSRQVLDQGRGAKRLLGITGEGLLETASAGVLEREIAPIGELTHLVDLDQVRVLEPRHGLGLGPEPGEGPEPGTPSRSIGDVDSSPDHLQRDQTLEAQVTRLVDDPHPTVTEDREQSVTRHVGGVVEHLGRIIFRIGRRRRAGRIGGLRFGSQGATEVDLTLEPRREPGETPAELRGVRRLTQRLAEGELAVNDGEGGLIVVMERRMKAEISLGRDALAREPALGLVVAAEVAKGVGTRLHGLRDPVAQVRHRLVEGAVA